VGRSPPENIAFLTRYSYAVGVYDMVVGCRLTVTDELWLNVGS